MNVRRHTDLSAFTRRLTPAEVAQLWFRRGREFGREIHAVHPDFPRAGPDGLYLTAEVEGWFDRWHGRRQSATPDRDAEDEAFRIARHGRGSHPSSAH